MEAVGKSKWLDNLQYLYTRAYQKQSWKIALVISGLFFHLIVWITFLLSKKTKHHLSSADIDEAFESSGRKQDLKEKIQQQELKKNRYLSIEKTPIQIEKDVEGRFQLELKNEKEKWKTAYYEDKQVEEYSYLKATLDAFAYTPLFILSIILAWPMYLFLGIVSKPTLYYLAARLVMMLFVIVGVTVIVFTLLYFSPSDPATNILGNQATPDQIENFRNMHGLNDSYWSQLSRTIKGVFTFDLGNAYQGNERVVTSLLRRFPVTLELTLFALSLSVIVALPAGVYAAVKANSTFDHLFMFIALIGISIPSFWQGLIFILTFSINLGWLPATYNVNNMVSLIMPAVVLGTGLMASVARMTRSSTLEVINEDYILTARAKGLSRSRIILRHAVPNALIPIVTVIGLQFGGMLGGSSVTEKVFNINGVGSYIVDKQFIPDIPSVMGGVIYIAIILSIVNMFVDMLYSFLDPRIRSNIQNGQYGK